MAFMWFTVIGFIVIFIGFFGSFLFHELRQVLNSNDASRIDKIPESSRNIKSM
ncbi:hypothetical protein [Bacillus smithii]|uniref:hypothetical protein n=1 Tax=Bacillus smithii TaxID=1479 RepID=UPI0030C8EC12